MIDLKSVFLVLALAGSVSLVKSQCCAGGSGSPIAGGGSQGVLQDRQVEINTNYQYIHTTRFYTGDSEAEKFLDSYSSNYLYTRVGYGLTKDLTMSVETGYWLNKTQVGLNNSETITSSGIGDLILFPRFNVLNRTSDSARTELTIGLGYKIPIGSYNDSFGVTIPFPPPGYLYYVQKPLAVQPSSGAHDIIFYSFFYRGFPHRDFSLFAAATYIKKGWNPLGEKIGDFASVGLFASKSFGKLGTVLQVRGEYVDQMKLNDDILMFAYPSYDPEATGSKKVFIAPQITYAFNLGSTKLILYALAEIPVYQFVTKTQIASEKQLTAGISYRFFANSSH